MPRTDHRKASAQVLAARATAEGWHPWVLASAVADECECTLLQAHRLGRGWTLDDVRVRLAEVGARVTVQQISTWETARSRPSEGNLDLLCRLYETRPDRLGFGHDYTPAEDSSSTKPTPSPGIEGAPWDESPTLGPVGSGPLAPQILTTLRQIRTGMTSVLESSLSELSIEQWERGAEEYGHDYQIRPPSDLLAASVRDFAEIQALLQRRQSADTRARLCRVTAQLAATAGIALVALGEHREARAWYHVAQLAADETGDRALRAWLVAREAVVPFYFGAPAASVALAERARLLAGSAVCSTAAWAPALEARGLARMGRQREAQDALRLAQNAFTRLGDSETADTAYGYTERQLAWHEGSMWTVIGDTRRAQAALDHARDLYAPDEYLDRALIAMDTALCLLRVGEISVACRETEQHLLGLPPDHLTGIVVARARDVLHAVPARAAISAPARDLRELVRETSRAAITAG